MRFSSFYLKHGIVLLLSAGLMSCMVGPDFHSPAAPKTNSYTASPLPKKTVSTPAAGNGGKAQYYEMGQDIPAEWWKLYHSQAINDLIQRGLANSPTLESAKATLEQARQNMYAQIGSSLLPAVNAQLGGQRQRFSNVSIGGSSGSSSSIFNLYNAGVNVTYTADVFGGARRQIESLRAQMDYQKFELDAAYLTLTSNIVTTAITAASLQAQIQVTYELIKAQEEELDIVKKQVQLGGASEANVMSQLTLVSQTRATLPPLQQSLAQARHSLAVLIGDLPSEATIPLFDLDKLVLPSRIPISVPSQLVRQRPDIRASEMLLESALAQVGVATANMYPQFNLTTAYGWQNTTISHLMGPNNLVWNYGANILQPIFAGGSLIAKKHAAVAAYESAAAQYRQTVLSAFQNVADALRAVQNDARTLRDQKDAEVAARKALYITRMQYRVGGVSYVNLLTAETTYQQTRIGRIQAQASRYSDTAALFQALGGGWWNAKQPY